MWTRIKAGASADARERVDQPADVQRQRVQRDDRRIALGKLRAMS